MKNLYEINGDEAVIFMHKKDGTLINTTIDIEDFEKIDMYTGTWYPKYSKFTQTHYVRGNCMKNKKWYSYSMSRIIMDDPDGFYIDHIDHDTLNNRKTNLRLVTAVENSQNLNYRTPNKSSGIRNVSWDKKSNKWRIYVNVNKKMKTFGWYSDLKEAESAAIELRKKYYVCGG